jgi:hypothetical protein
LSSRFSRTCLFWLCGANKARDQRRTRFERKA